MREDSNTEKGRKFDGEKTRWNLIPWEQLEYVAEVLTLGAEKYEDDNWKRVPMAGPRYFAAAFRHIIATTKGEWVDPETGKPHLAHAICCLLFLLWFYDNGKKESASG